MEAHKEVRTVTTETICVVMSKEEAIEIIGTLEALEATEEALDQFHRNLRRAVSSTGMFVNGEVRKS